MRYCFIYFNFVKEIIFVFFIFGMVFEVLDGYLVYEDKYGL